MVNRSTKFASAVFVSVLAGVTHTTANSVAHAADDCLSGPTNQPPPGSHWYYRVDRVAKRHCWYLGEERERLSRVAPKGSTRLAKPASPRQETATLSFADARAEMPSAQTWIKALSRSDASIPITPENARVETSQRDDARDANTQHSIVASRWPQPSDTSRSSDPAPTTGNLTANNEPASLVAPPPVSAAGQLAQAALSPQTEGTSVQLQLAMLLGALALASLLGKIVAQFGRSEGFDKLRATIREATDDDKVLVSARPGTNKYPRPSRFARDLDRARRNDRIAAFFSQLSEQPRP
jgi:hypothetical protein